MPAALATASAITPTRAPCRSSPPSRRRRKVCSTSVAAANSPGPARPGAPATPSRRPRRSRRTRRRRAATVSVGSCAAGGNERNAAHPTPIWRCGSSPDSQDTTTATSFGSPSSPARAQQVGDPGDLGQPRRGGADLGRRGRDVDQQHVPTLARPSDISQQLGEDGGLGVQHWRLRGSRRAALSRSSPRPSLCSSDSSAANFGAPSPATCRQLRRWRLDRRASGRLGVVDRAECRAQRATPGRRPAPCGRSSALRSVRARVGPVGPTRDAKVRASVRVCT